MEGDTRTIALGGLASFRIQRLELRAVAGPDKGRDFELWPRISTVGSGFDADVHLNDPTVSRNHCRVEVTPHGHLLVDEGSKNGTFVDELRVERVYLRPGVVIRLGETRLEVRDAREDVEIPLSRQDRFGSMLGRSLAMRQTFGVLERVAKTDVTVLLEGESGTGKEVAAREIHRHGKRADGPFVVFDCGAVPRELLESELFGHVRGAFTHAVKDHVGAFQAAHGGTLFLDEIGELDLDLQPKLLRVLETHEVRPVGASRPRKVDVRVVAATNRNLQDEVRKGSFREDLYYRLAVIRTRIPPLRAREEDIPLLVGHFIETLAREHGLPPLKISYETMVKLKRHPWRGNVRELKNFIERSLVLAGTGLDASAFLSDGLVERVGEGMEAPVVRQEGADEEGAELVLRVRTDAPFKEAKAELLGAFERAYWTRMLEAHGGNVTRAAKASGIHRKSLEYLMKKYGLRAGARGEAG